MPINVQAAGASIQPQVNNALNLKNQVNSGSVLSIGYIILYK